MRYLTCCCNLSSFFSSSSRLHTIFYCACSSCVFSTYYICRIFFFFQAEDGIRDLTVTGVQTCALPISDVPLEIVDVGVGDRLQGLLLDRDLPALADQFLQRFLPDVIGEVLLYDRRRGLEIGRAHV